jgi:hypothetical protein
MTVHQHRYTERDALRRGETIDFEGVKLRMVPGKDNGRLLEPGDTYFAQRNSSNLLTVDRIREDDGEYIGWVVPVEVAYSFDYGECVGVELVEA